MSADGPLTFEVGPWVKGLNASSDPMLLGLDELDKADDVIIDKFGTVKIRGGYQVAYAGSISGDMSKMVTWVPDPEEDEVIVGWDWFYAKLWVSRDENWANVDGLALTASGGSATTKDRWITSFVSLNDSSLYMVADRGVAPSRLNWNGASSPVTVTTLTTATFSVADSDAGTPANQFPTARFGLSKHERIWVARVTYGGTTYPSRIHYSDLLRNQRWYGLDYFDVDPDDGGEIQAMVAYGEAIMIFKEHSVHMLTGTGPDTFALTTLDHGIGTVAPNSVVVRGADVYFHDRHNGVMWFDGAQFRNISDNVMDSPSTLYWDSQWKYHSFIFDGVLYVSTVGSSDSHVYCYNLEAQLWYRWTYGITAAAPRGGALIFDHDADIGFMDFNTGLDDDGTAIDSAAWTGYLTPTGGSTQVRVDRLDVFQPYVAGDVGEFTVSISKDFQPSGSGTWASSTMTNNQYERIRRLGGFGAFRWYTTRLRIENDDGDRFGVSKVAMRLSTGSRRRGVEGA